MVKIVVQHITEGNQLYWAEADVPDSDVTLDGVYIGKPLEGTQEGFDKTNTVDNG